MYRNTENDLAALEVMKQMSIMFYPSSLALTKVPNKSLVPGPPPISHVIMGVKLKQIMTCALHGFSRALHAFASNAGRLFPLFGYIVIVHFDYFSLGLYSSV